MKAVHAGLDAAELREFGLRAEVVIDFSASINPLGTSEAVREAAASLAAATIHRVAADETEGFHRSIESVAQAAGLGALADQGHIEAAREVVRASKAYLYEQFASMGLDVTNFAANFLLVKVAEAARVRTELLRLGIVVRDCASFGLSGHIRVAVRPAEECAPLVSALRQVLGR